MNRIIILRSSSENFGGIEGQVCRIAEGYARELFIEPVLVTSNRKSFFAKSYTKLGFPVEVASHLGSSTRLAVEEVHSIVQKYGAKAIQSHMFRESIVARMVRFRRKELAHIARVHTYIDCSWIPSWKKWAYHILEKLTERGVDRYVSITYMAQRELVERSWIQSRRIIVVPNAVPQLGAPDAPHMDTNPLPLKVAMISNLLDHKGHDVLVRSLAELKRRGLLVQVRLVGGELTNTGDRSTPFTDRLKKMAQETGVLEQMEFHGYTRDVYGAIRGYPVVVLPSDSEGLPNCLLEALSVRKLVVASRVGGIPEIINHGENGLLHAVQDHKGFADILARIFTTPAHSWEHMRNQALETWHSRFSVESMIQGLAQIYRELGIIE